MQFHSIEFFIFFFVVYAGYLVCDHRLQNVLLLAASYFFYGFWDWRFLSLILLSTVVDFICGLHIAKSPERSRKKFFLLISLCVNLGLLGFFKYFNFFQESFLRVAHLLGFSADPVYLHIILPVGISFYTFQTLSYTMDIYRGKINPTRRFLDFALYVSFFPQLVAGPIERASTLLPQILSPRRLRLDNVKEGFFLIYWGLFEKLYIASNMGRFVDPVFLNYREHNGFEIFTAAFAFAFQIFADFDAYSNIARGLAKCFGFEIMVNFNLPYFSLGPRDFWRRWHISLSTWLRDYLYIPLGGSRRGPLRTSVNLFLVMLLGGLWHGAALTFLAWGAYHGLLLVLARNLPRQEDPPGMVKAGQACGFFGVVLVGWILFRASTLGQAFDMIGRMFLDFRVSRDSLAVLLECLAYLTPLLIVQVLQCKTGDLMVLRRPHWLWRTILYSFMAYLMVGWGVLTANEFIYFQF